MNAIDKSLKALEYATYYLRDDVSASPIQEAHKELQQHKADTVCISRQELEAMRKPNEWIPTSKREKDMANHAHNALIKMLLERE